MANTIRNSKISLDQAKEIRNLWNLPKGVRPTQTEIAKKFGITQAAVSYIVNKKRWADEEVQPENTQTNETSTKLPAGQPSLFAQY